MTGSPFLEGRVECQDYTPWGRSGNAAVPHPLIQSAPQSVGYQTLDCIIMFTEWIMKAEDEEANYLPQCHFFPHRTVRTEY